MDYKKSASQEDLYDDVASPQSGGSQVASFLFYRPEKTANDPIDHNSEKPPGFGENERQIEALFTTAYTY